MAFQVLNHSVVLVTGGSRGIGAATAKHLAKLGYAVCVNYIANETAAHHVVSDIEKEGGKAIAVQADVSNDDDVIRLFDTLDNTLGPVTHLVNNAGILLPQMRVTDMSAERINKVLMSANCLEKHHKQLFFMLQRSD